MDTIVQPIHSQSSIHHGNPPEAGFVSKFRKAHLPVLKVPGGLVVPGALHPLSAIAHACIAVTSSLWSPWQEEDKLVIFKDCEGKLSPLSPTARFRPGSTAGKHRRTAAAAGAPRHQVWLHLDTRSNGSAGSHRCSENRSETNTSVDSGSVLTAAQAGF